MLLAALAHGDAPDFVPAPGLLLDPPAGAKHLPLPLELELQGPEHGPKAVHILHFDLGFGKLGLAPGPNADVGVAAKAALLHIPGAHAQVPNDRPHLRQIQTRLLGRPEVRLAHDLHQRRPRTVQVDQAVVLARVVAAMQQLGRILFEMHPHDSSPLSLAIQVDLQPAVAGDRQVVLRDLIALDQVGVGVVLPIELVALVDGAIQGQTGEDRGIDSRLVDHRQHAGHPHADRADPRVGRRRLIVGGAVAEHLAAGQELCVDLEADDRLVLGRLMSRYHGTSIASAPPGQQGNDAPRFVARSRTMP